MAILKNIYPDCGKCKKCDNFCMKDECMEKRFGKKYVKDFYGQVASLRKLIGYKEGKK